MASRAYGRRVGAVLVALGLLVAPSAGEAEDSILTWGDNLPASLDPHTVYDVPAAFPRLNVYDSLLRYVGNPPEIKP